MWLYLDELQLKFEFRSGGMIFGWVMALELVFFVCSNCKLSGDLFDVLWYIDLIFGMWLYLNELQFIFELRSGCMIFGWVMALELVFFVCSNCKLSGDLFDVLWYIDLIFGMWLYLDELHFKLEFRFGRMIFGWVMALELVFYVQILSSPDVFSRLLRYWLDIWYVAISRWDTVEDRISFWSNDLWLSYGLWTCIFCSNFKLSGHLFDVLWYIDLIFGMWLYLDELQLKLEFRSGQMIFGWVMALELVFYVQILSSPNFFLSFDILTWYLVCGYIQVSYSLYLNFVLVEWFLAVLWPLNLYFLFVQIVSCPEIYLTFLDILTWYLVCGYI
jgi:hypothetical protein